MVVTLPALGGLRKAFPRARLDLLGHAARARLAQHPRYVDQVTDLERWDVYRLFSQSPVVSAAFAAYLRTCTMILSYLPTADTAFGQNLQGYCQGEVSCWPPHPPADVHVTEHLLQPVRRWLGQPCNLSPQVYLEPQAEARATHFWRSAGLPERGTVAFHPGSGGTHKLWPLEGWQQVLQWAVSQGIPGLLISGPAEHERALHSHLRLSAPHWPYVQGLSLPDLAALLARCDVVVGHDSGVTHLAAAVGSTVLALFGPTDPYVWGPRSTRACVLWPHPPGALTLATLPPEAVMHTLEALLYGSFLFMPSRVDCTVLGP